MSTLDRNIAVTLLLYFILAIGGFVLIFSIISLTEELRTVGRGSYGVGDAVWFVFLRLPAEAFEVFPGAALVGCVMGLGALAANGELIAMQACGFSYYQIAASALKPGVLAGVAILLLAELVAAPLAHSAHLQRVVAISDGRTLASATGLWMRSNSSIVNVRSPMTDGTLREVFLYELGTNNRLSRYSYASSGRHTADGWHLEDVVERSIHENGVDVLRVASKPWDGLPQPRDVQTMLLPAESLSLVELRTTIATLRGQNLLTHRYELAFWKRVTTPAMALVMMLIGMPMVMGSIATRRHGPAVVLAALAGVGFQMLNQTFGTFALVYHLPPLFGAIAPGLVALLVGVRLFRKLH